MKLPGADKLVVGREKIVDYLLNPAHRYGASKARFFAGFGFRVEKWEWLAEALWARVTANGPSAAVLICR